MSLVNNGLPAGLNTRDIAPGDIIEIKWNDHPNELVIVLQSPDLMKRRTYKGYVSINVMTARTEHNGRSWSIDGSQVVRHTGRNVFDQLAV